jgi:hypothetical protein
LSFLAGFEIARTQTFAVSTFLQSSCGFTRLALQELCLEVFVSIVRILLRYYKQTVTHLKTRPFRVNAALIVAIETPESASPRRNAKRVPP